MVVSPEPARRKIPDLIQRIEQVLAQPVVAYGAVVTLDMRVLLRITGLDKLDVDAVLFCPGFQCKTDVLRVIVTTYLFRLLPRHSMI